MLAAAGIAAIIAVNFGLSVVLSQSITERLLHGEGLVKQEFLNSILTAENSAGELFSPPAPSAALLLLSTVSRTAEIFPAKPSANSSLSLKLTPIRFGSVECRMKPSGE